MFVDQRSQSLNLCALAHVVKWKLEILGSKAWGEDKVNNAEAGGEVKCLKYLERERGRLSGTDCHERVSQTNFGTAADFCTPVMLFPDKSRVWNCKRFFLQVGVPEWMTGCTLATQVSGHWTVYCHVDIETVYDTLKTHVQTFAFAFNVASTSSRLEIGVARQLWQLWHFFIQKLLRSDRRWSRPFYDNKSLNGSDHPRSLYWRCHIDHRW